jgi:TonB family protein
MSPVPFAERYIPPKPTRQVLPKVSDLPRSILTGTNQVVVTVKVDANGSVTDAQAQPSPEKVARPIIDAAETAARQWAFQPARLDGKPVSSEHSIVFQFGR